MCESLSRESLLNRIDSATTHRATALQLVCRLWRAQLMHLLSIAKDFTFLGTRWRSPQETRNLDGWQRSMVALDSCCILGISQATFEGILLTLTGAALVCRSDLLVVSKMTALLLQDSLEGVSPVRSSLLESLRSPMLESSSAVVLVISKRPTLFNEKSSSLVGFLNCANVMLL